MGPLRRWSKRLKTSHMRVSSLVMVRMHNELKHARKDAISVGVSKIEVLPAFRRFHFQALDLLYVIPSCAYVNGHFMRRVTLILRETDEKSDDRDSAPAGELDSQVVRLKAVRPITHKVSKYTHMK